MVGNFHWVLIFVIFVVDMAVMKVSTHTGWQLVLTRMAQSRLGNSAMALFFYELSFTFG